MSDPARRQILELLKKGKVRTHILILYVSELLQLTVSVILLGWSAGFQLPLIGLTGMVFLFEYLGRSVKLAYIPALPLALVDFGVYVLAYPRFFYAPGVYGLPQSAVYGARHLVVAKAVAGGRTRATISEVTGTRRVAEIARMLGGEKLTSVVKRHAEELLQISR